MVGVDVQWKEPCDRFCDSQGHFWEYQSTPELTETIRGGLEHHHENTIAGSVDKLHHPLFLVLSGPGTGKSRLLDEFHRIACDTCNCQELLYKLEEAYVFKVSFENGTRESNGEMSGAQEIGARMYFQLHPDSVK